MPTKDVGTTNDKTTMPLICKPINSDQDVTHFSLAQVKQQPTKYTDKPIDNPEIRYSVEGRRQERKIG